MLICQNQETKRIIKQEQTYHESFNVFLDYTNVISMELLYDHMEVDNAGSSSYYEY